MDRNTVTDYVVLVWCLLVIATSVTLGITTGSSVGAIRFGGIVGCFGLFLIYLWERSRT